MEPHWIPASVGIGSNLDDPEFQVRSAFAALELLPDSRMIATSYLYRNPPMGPSDQPDYVNAVAGLLTRLAPATLLSELLNIEQQRGRLRDPGDRWGPRIIDLDLLVYSDRLLAEPGLTIPHPGISERNFVLLPLLDIAPWLWIPGAGTVTAIASRVDGSALQRIG